MFLAVGTCKMCILCSVLVALEAAGLLHVSVEASCVSQIGLYICQTYTGLKGLHTHRKGILSIPRTPLYYTIYKYRGYGAQ